MPIAFDSPASAPHGTLPAHAGRAQEEDASAADAFAQLFLAAASPQSSATAAQDGKDPTQGDPNAVPPEGPFLMLSLPVPAPVLPVPGEVRIVALEKRATAIAQPIAANASADAGIGPDDATPLPAPRLGAADPRAQPPVDSPARPAVDAAKPRVDASQASSSLLAALGAHAEVDKATSAKVQSDRASLVSPLVAIAAAHPTPAATHVDTVAAPAFTPGWQDETVAKLAHIVVTRNERAELKLNPAELGPVSVRVDMNADHASLTIVAASPETRSALEQSLPQLRDLLASQGITLGQASVHDGSAQRDAPAQPWTATAQGSRDGDGAARTPTDAVQRILRRADRLVDVFA